MQLMLSGSCAGKCYSGMFEKFIRWQYADVLGPAVQADPPNQRSLNRAKVQHEGKCNQAAHLH